MGYNGRLCLSFFNEPLLDKRIPEFADYSRRKGLKPYLVTNGDFLSKDVASQLDGSLYRIVVSIYGPDPNNTRKKNISSMFSKTPIKYKGDHSVSHFMKIEDYKKCVERTSSCGCQEPSQKMIIKYNGDSAMCCEDVANNFDIGNIFNRSLSDIWFDKNRQYISNRLKKRGGRMLFKYCRSCPRYI